MRSEVRIGSRESPLALAQAREAAEYIHSHTSLKAVIIPMKTRGDQILDKTLDQVGGKGLFVKELDLALLEGRTDLSVHSLKDLPLEISEDLPLLAFSRREDPRDALVLPEGVKELNPEKPLGCSSLRRTLQLREIFPEMQVKSIRGNLGTRLAKLDGGEYAGLILAAAGLKRLGLKSRIARYFTPEEMIPAAGQGILAVQGRRGEDYSFLEGYSDPDSEAAALCERSFVAAWGGDCFSPVGAYAQVSGEEIFLRGVYFDEESGRLIRGSIRGKRWESQALGAALAENLKNGR